MQNALKMKYVLLILGIFFLGCRSSGQKNKFPEKIPTDFSLAYHVDGGMRYYSEDLFISKESCSYVIDDGGRKTTKKFMLSAAEMDAMYDILKNNRTDQIKSRTEDNVYDRGGISISMAWDKGRHELQVSDAQLTFVEKKWWGQWQAICNYLADLIKRKAK